MSYSGILFDLDGTLLPMDMNTFTSGYFKELGKVLCPLGFDFDELVATIWGGTKAMAQNDGTHTNSDVFWKYFEERHSTDIDKIKIITEEFYGNQFKAAKAFTGDNPLATKAVALAKEKAPHVVLATNPLFPMPGQCTRLGFVGLTAEDFDLVTSYEEERFSKPSIEYYQSICDRLNLNPKDCLMIGNDVKEDMHPAKELGMDTFLVTDCIIEWAEHPYTGKSGTFEELISFLESI